MASSGKESTAAPLSSANTPVGRRVNDFKFGKELGVGSFSQVCVGREIETGNEFAIKVVDKTHVKRNKAIDSVYMEKEVLIRTGNHPFIVRLYYTFQDKDRLYFVLSYAKRGELLTYLTELTSFNLECTQFYTAEIFSAIDYLHKLNIVHRDLKPENVLLTEHMHIILADFGSAVILDAPHVKPSGFTGTPEYVSPEMLNRGGSHTNPDDEDDAIDEKSLPETEKKQANGDEVSSPEATKSLCYLMDFWAFGCIIYQLLSGRPPFRLAHNSQAHEYEIFQKILGLQYSFPEGFDETAKELVRSLLVIKPRDRIGSPKNGSHDAIRVHPFFTGVEWSTLSTQTPPTLVPNLPPLTQAQDWDNVPVGYEEGQKYQLACEIQMITENDRNCWLHEQQRQNPFHRFTRQRLVLKQGILFKRRGLFARKRMFLLTEGPHLFYVDPDAMVLKGEVPWTSMITLEMKSNKIFYIHTPSRTYYLEDPTGNSQEWIDKLNEVKNMYFAENSKASSET